jgi:hypothetical protein
MAKEKGRKNRQASSFLGILRNLGLYATELREIFCTFAAENKRT